ncbi:NAD-dependent epimerase/dehydratase family protein [Wenxinia marina]|uniref:Nucleoside-diphosphate-sugar epimerase n=1 Tax=Wenxinia marina DSM 24838 TaxID=1123501 RepID=A0A0D0NS65_9RHOB|nr:NAD-dependent epimerase/dehydratase family protein [Wenxinia marina]KIQ71075.1 Nucleoside-diphosphate-sugar epimerase [Wenxinia marina DSM 24838]GGL55051.1 hypothetical protein GCM10011392_06810 [Wenxinia marina]
MPQDHTPPAAEKPLILITGADGNIGRRLCTALADDYRVVGLDRTVEEDAPCDSYEADLTDPASLELALNKVAETYGREVASVIHLAAFFDFSGEDKAAYQAVNVEGTRKLLEALDDFDVEQVVYSGTMLVHEAARPGETIDEDAPIDPSWPYPQSKARTEEAIRETAGDAKATFLHIAGLYDDETAVPTLSHQIARIYERGLKSRFYSGDLSAGQSFVHIDDLVAAFRKAVDRREELPDRATILIGEEHAIGYDALQRRLADLIHDEPAWRTITVPKALAKAAAWAETKSEPVVPDAFDQGEKPFIRPFMIDLSSDHYALDISRARELLDWQPDHRIEDGLTNIVAALKRDPIGWYKANGITPPPWMTSAAERGERPDEIRQRHLERYRAGHRGALWAHWANAGFGIWMMTSPPLLGYDEVWLGVTDVLAGLVLFLAAMASLSWRLAPARWVCAAVGVWLMFAPLIFWSDTGSAYLNGTLVGLIVTALAVAVGPPPGISPTAAVTGPTTPKGWDYSPSEWFQRLPVIILAVVGLLVSRYLGAYQLETIPGVWEPFFGSDRPPLNGTEAIITSSVSEAWPVPDAGVGALTYALEIVVGVVGSAARWRTMPWLVVLFGIMIVPLGAVSIFFIVIQPILLGTYCTLCLIAAAAMLFQIPYSIDEIVATYQFLKRRHRAGQPWLRVFFTGDTDEGPDEPRDVDDFEQSPRAIVKEMVLGGMTYPWTLAASAALGVVLMLSPLVLTWESGLSAVNHVVGALVLTFSVTALAVVARAARFMNALLGVVLLFAPFMVESSWLATFASFAFALALIALSIPKGNVEGNYDDWRRFIV